MRATPAFLATAAMRPGSRPMGSRLPLSTSIVSPDEETKSVDCPPSVSMKTSLADLVS